jgi:hypothetical protein
MTQLVFTPEERDTGDVYIKSDVYERGNDLYWVAVHPGSGWTAYGTAATIDEAYQAITVAVETASGVKASSDSVLVIRPLFDGLKWV